VSWLGERGTVPNQQLAACGRVRGSIYLVGDCRLLRASCRVRAQLVLGKLGTATPTALHLGRRGRPIRLYVGSNSHFSPEPNSDSSSTSPTHIDCRTAEHVVRRASRMNVISATHRFTGEGHWRAGCSGAVCRLGGELRGQPVAGERRGSAGRGAGCGGTHQRLRRRSSVAERDDIAVQ
jgi:hypothetical protein